MMKPLTLTAIATLALAITPFATTQSAAQDFSAYQQRQKDLVAISSVFGTLHHIRRTCEPRREGDMWRERMKRLVELEEPQTEVREEMVKSFNTAYRGAQSRFVMCDRRARDYAAARARLGDDIVARLTAPLYDVIAEDQAAARAQADENSLFVGNGSVYPEDRN